MFHIGGEQEIAPLNYFQDVTNSGRSSLRLIIESANLRNKQILLPNFLCQVIVDVLEEYNITFDFYSVDKSLELQLPKNIEKYDALYLIKYFGGRTKTFVQACCSFKGCVIVDDVFSPLPEFLKRSSLWFSYNSLRKISPVADFSLVYSNIPLAGITKTSLADFSALKYQAKNLKYDYLQDKSIQEETYLDLFSQGENLLDNGLGIYAASVESIITALSFFNDLNKERTVRNEHYQLIRAMLPKLTIDIDSEFYSFAPIFIKNRNELRKQLIKENIYLAVHWSEVKCIKNELSPTIISLPLDRRYSNENIIKLCELILIFTEHSK